MFELTGDYGFVLPLMLAAGLATFLADRINADSVYTHPLRKRGIVYGQPEDVDILQTVTVGEVMSTRHPRVRSGRSARGRVPQNRRIRRFPCAAAEAREGASPKTGASAGFRAQRPKRARARSPKPAHPPVP